MSLADIHSRLLEEGNAPRLTVLFSLRPWEEAQQAIFGSAKILVAVRNRTNCTIFDHLAPRSAGNRNSKEKA